MDYYSSKIKQFFAIFGEPKVDIIVGIIFLIIGIVVSRANNTQAGTGIFVVLGILFFMMGMFGMSGGMWNF